MRRFCRFLGWLPCFTLLAAAASARAEARQDPLRLMPDKADLIFKIEEPRKLVETVYGLELFKKLQKIDAIREVYESTNSRRFYQLVDYYEKQLGMKWQEMLDRIAG